MKSLKIGNIKLKNPLFLAPMLDITNLPYRLLCRKAGAAMAYTEMVYTSAILHENKKTKEMLLTSKEDKPLGLQITGNNPQEFETCIPFIKDKSYSLIDLNCGCPSIKLINNQAGACLLKEPEKIAKIIKILKKQDLIVTAKIRLGFKENKVLEIAKNIEKAGADALTVHARLATHDYSTPSDLNEIKKAKHNLGIPVIGNGDIFSGQDAQKMLEIADGAMIARGAIGNPLIFKQILYYLKTGKEKPFSLEENLCQFKNYLNLCKKYKLVHLAKIKHLGTHFIKNIPKASSYREKIMHLENIDKIKMFIKKPNI